MFYLKNKKILLILTKFFSYDELIKEKLIEFGAHVDLIDGRAKMTIFDKMINKISRKPLQFKQNNYHKKICKKLSNNNYDFIFSNTFLPKKIIQMYRKTFPNAKSILYLDDSIKNLSGVEHTFDCYHFVYSFDRDDCEKYKLLFRPLFFSDYFSLTASKTKEYDICFIGTIHSDRLKIIDAIDSFCKENNLSFFKYCYLPSKLLYFYYFFTKKEFRKHKPSFFKYNQLTNLETANFVNKSKTVLDIEHPKQTGLTMRTIESIGSKTKIITTNLDVSTYDFYNQNNVFLIERVNPKLEKSFFCSPFMNLDKDSYYFYSLSGWIDFIFSSGLK